MTKLIRIAGAVLLASIAAFCVFGFLAAAEVPAESIGYRIFYSVVGLSSLCTAGWLTWRK